MTVFIHAGASGDWFGGPTPPKNCNETIVSKLLYVPWSLIPSYTNRRSTSYCYPIGANQLSPLNQNALAPLQANVATKACVVLEISIAGCDLSKAYKTRQYYLQPGTYSNVVQVPTRQNSTITFEVFYYEFCSDCTLGAPANWRTVFYSKKVMPTDQLVNLPSINMDAPQFYSVVGCSAIPNL